MGLPNDALAERADYGSAAPANLFKASEGDLLRLFDFHFKAIDATSSELIAIAHQIRYQVYCVEHAFECEADHPDGLEQDAFDRHAAHGLLFDRASDSAVGTVRLILPLHDSIDESFAIQRVCDHPALRGSSVLPLHSTAEVSRFSISKHYRRRKTDILQGDGAVGALHRCGPLLRLGLIQSLIRMSVERGVTHWCALMEPSLLRILAGMAIRFNPLGPPVDFHGLRQPCYLHVGKMLRDVENERPAFWQVLTDGGILYERLLKII